MMVGLQSRSLGSPGEISPLDDRLSWDIRRLPFRFAFRIERERNRNFGAQQAAEAMNQTNQRLTLMQEAIDRRSRSATHGYRRIEDRPADERYQAGRRISGE
jgi:hypothetical protein